MTSTPLSYLSAPSPWSAGEPSPLPNTLLLSLLTTTLTYQLTALFSDILLGTKPKKRYPIPMLQTALLTHQTGPLPTLTALLRLDPLTRLYHRPSLPPTTRIVRDPESIRPKVVVRLLVVVLLAPVLNAICFTFPLTTTRTLTFAEAGFPPVSLSPSANPPTARTVTSIVRRIPIQHPPLDFPLVLLHIFTPPPFLNDAISHKAQITLISRSGTHVSIKVQIGSQISTQVIVPTLTLLAVEEQKHFAIRVNATEAAIDHFLRIGIAHAADVCGEDVLKENATRVNVPIAGQHMVSLGAIRLSKCRIRDDDAEFHAQRIANVLKNMVSIVETEQMAVAHNTMKPEFFDPADLPFLRRRRRNVPLIVLGIVTSAVVVVRTAVAWLWNNDIEDALLLIVKHTVGVGCCESLLAVEDRVAYDCKYQIGQAARFGLPVKGMNEVSEFHGGVLDEDGEFIDFDYFGPDNAVTNSNDNGSF